MKSIAVVVSLAMLPGCGVNTVSERQATWDRIAREHREATATATQIEAQAHVDLVQSIQVSHEASSHLMAVLKKSERETLADMKRYPDKYRRHGYVRYEPEAGPGLEKEGLWPDACDEYAYVSRHIDCQ